MPLKTSAELELASNLKLLPFGKSRSKVIDQLGEPSSSESSLIREGLTDYYDTLIIEYDGESGKCCSVEFTGEELIVEGQNLLALSWTELSNWMIERDPTLKPGQELESVALRISAGAKPPEYKEVESIALYAEDYRWPTEEDLRALMTRIDAKMPSAAEIAKELGLEDYF